MISRIFEGGLHLPGSVFCFGHCFQNLQSFELVPIPKHRDGNAYPEALPRETTLVD